MTGRDRFQRKESAQSRESKPGAHTPTQPARYDCDQPAAGSKVTEDRHYSAAVITTPSRLPCLCLPGPGVAFADDVPFDAPTHPNQNGNCWESGRRSPQKAVSPPAGT
jgi:hypothetical protein